MAWLSGVRGMLCDVDGTLVSGDREIPGAVAALRRIRDAGIDVRLTTNTTRFSRKGVAEMLRAAGFDIDFEAILNPAVLARRRILASGKTRAALLVADAAGPDFEGVEPAGEDPDWVVMGDLGEDFDWQVMQRAFAWVRGGARLMALQRNRFWDAGDGVLRIDAGAFVAGLEYASGVEAELVGKPSSIFFEEAVGSLGIEPGAILAVGDDVTTDGAGGAAAGCRTATVRTGKFEERQLEESGFAPDLLIDSFAALNPS
ncbi:MAG: TIGR01458 family HAD-type hydrolase [Acidobacteria bacterium]|nr:TIGR01458 family HAD-type hydrolase [Acidobacteriota bacterium]NIM64220.1 TIGR01458 family HAD-type hydrolase [Acidobacteriota bacterium]NIO59218.1 TIGR01458 family HAD-type hydrolase [Acidobacteriota bacterium]NIQ30245.1 TIGR01458 family HAD-type hydrolase [Acidobacteriota bacterium]NIQ85173.1 TIGR01458 family HAD-type hydrolase [Acidobacteriota bacterium]